jgi:hypothetical protein
MAEVEWVDQRLRWRRGSEERLLVDVEDRACVRLTRCLERLCSGEGGVRLESLG